MTTVTVLIPVLDRPHRVRPLLHSLRASEGKVKLEPLFVATPGDHDELRELLVAGAPHMIVSWEAGYADYARKINYACRLTDTDWLFAGADDLDFRAGWADHAVRTSEQTGKRFVSTNDLGNPLVRRGKHATHPLVHRSYLPLAVIDSPGDLYSEAYQHECVDVEATGTAQARGEFVFSNLAVVEHIHPIWKKAPMDATYEKGRSLGKQDRELCKQRTPLWANLS